MLSRERWIPTTGNYLNHRPVLMLPARSCLALRRHCRRRRRHRRRRRRQGRTLRSRPAPRQPVPATATACPGLPLRHVREKSHWPQEGKPGRGRRKVKESEREMEGGEKARRAERAGRARAAFPNLAAQRAGAAPSGGSPGRFESAGDGTEPGSLSGLGLPRSLPARRAPPFSLPAGPPAGARAPAPPPSDCPPPHLPRAGNAWPRGGRPGGGGLAGGGGEPHAAPPPAT